MARMYEVSGLAFCLLFLFVGSSISEEKKPTVTLKIEKATATHDKQDTLFTFDVILDNQTGEQLTVISNFNSAFDGLDMVVTDSEGKLLKQQGYTFHQSPYSTGRAFVLDEGETKTTLVFPVDSFAREGDKVTVQLTGSLPGSTYEQFLSSNKLQVEIKKKKD